MNWSANEVPPLTIRINSTHIDRIHQLAAKLGTDPHKLAAEILDSHLNLLESLLKD